jgi:ribosomal-protein-alanine N-acetyltransferase
MIIGQRINLRLVREKEIDDLYLLISNLENRGEHFPQSLVPEPLFKKLFYETGFWNDEFGRMVIVNKDDDIVGDIYYMRAFPYSDGLEIDYIIFDSKNYGKGYVSEALQLMINYLFATKTMNRIQLRISQDNEASKKVALKAGFKYDGIREQVLYLNGKHIDLEEYVLLRKDYVIK